LAVKTKSIFEPAQESDGYRVLITRFYPRGIRRTHFDEWVSSLSPNRDLLFGYKEGRIDWDSFMDSFFEQLKNDVESVEAIHALYDSSRNRDITLLCFEKDGVPCHRHFVRDVIENPMLIGLRLKSEDADDHERISVQHHVPNQEAPVIV
jgi:uncharacterized protein YeaO (DUF488 family)